MKKIGEKVVFIKQNIEFKIWNESLLMTLDLITVLFQKFGKDLCIFFGLLRQ
jgi:hypothetical protein